ncbi:MAG: phosphoribosylaminoimidazolesuccinocarboxamide synthase [Myxococcota bacterium]
MNDTRRQQIQAQLAHTLERTDLDIGTKYEGKVRDVYRIEDRLLLVTTDRVSAFDVLLGTVPFKGQILNGMALLGFRTTEDIVSNHVLSSPHPNVLVARACTPYPVEFVMRGYVTGSLWRDYQAGTHLSYEVPLPSGLRRDERLPEPVLTPTTKARLGAHDAPVSRREIIASGTMTAEEWEEAAAVAHQLYLRGREVASKRGLILVDTKYELGRDSEGRLTLIDEVHTPDSSRYWMAEEYEARFAEGEPQLALDKENLRSWLRERHGFTGEGTPPELDDDIRILLSERYMDAFHLLVGESFEPEVGPVSASLRRAVEPFAGMKS